MKAKMDTINRPGSPKARVRKIEFQGYPEYPAGEDIFSKYHEEKNIDPEEISKRKEFIEYWKDGVNNEKDFKDDVSGSDLDFPGSAFDDQLEMIESEDEENSFYSTGGDNHNNLDEN